MKRLRISHVILLCAAVLAVTIAAAQRNSSRFDMRTVELRPLPPQEYAPTPPAIEKPGAPREVLALPPDPAAESVAAAAAPSPQVSSDEQKRCTVFEPLFRMHGLEPVETFSYIAWRESRCDPRAHNKTRNRNGSQDYGLLQINSTWKTVTSTVCRSKYGDMDVLFNLDCNLRVARYLLDNGGLGHWSM
jgi:hypothetical protein